MKQLNTLQKFGLVIIFVIGIIILGTLLPQLPKFTKDRAIRTAEWNKLVSIGDVQEIYINQGRKEVRLHGEEMIHFLEQVRQKSIPYRSSGPRDEVKIYFKIKDSNQGFQFSLAPDAYHRGELWIYSEKSEMLKINEISRVKSDWLWDFFIQKGMLDETRLDLRD